MKNVFNNINVSFMYKPKKSHFHLHFNSTFFIEYFIIKSWDS